MWESKEENMKKRNGYFVPHVGTNHKIKLEKYKIKNFPLYCPKCKQENLINASKLKITVIKEPDT